jgi:nucleoside permease NupC
VPANHLLTASIMAAPAGLAISKVIQPEIKITQANWAAIEGFPKGYFQPFFSFYFKRKTCKK